MSDDVVSLCDRIGPYFDGELGPAEEARFVRHLAGCEHCGAELEELMGLQAALAGRGGVDAGAAAAAARRAEVVAGAAAGRARQWPWLVGAGAAALAAAAAVVLILGGRGGGGGGREAPVAIALAPTRGVEVRFAAEGFAAHRPYDLVRSGSGGGARDAVSLTTLAELERRGDRAALAAALAVTGEVARARTVLGADGGGAAADGDRAAVALLDGDAEAALVLADRALAAGAGPAARWNRALALRELGLPLAAAAELTTIARVAEPGWADEATARAAALTAEHDAERSAAADVFTRGQAMITGGALLTAADAQRFSAEARFDLLDALRAAPDAAAIERLRPLALALDDEAVAEVDRVRARSAAVRAQFRPRYQALASGELAPPAVDALLRDLARAGDDVLDLRIGALVISGRVVSDPAPLTAALARAPSRWYALYAEHARLALDRAAGRDVEPALRALTADCSAPTLAFRCAALELDLAEVLQARGASSDALVHARRAHDLYRAAGTPSEQDSALLYVGEIARMTGRHALAGAIFDEVARRAHDQACAVEHYAQVGAALLALEHGDAAGARAALPMPGACADAAIDQAVAVAVDLARTTGADVDGASAGAWLAEAARRPVTPMLAIGRARLQITRDAAAGRAALTAAITALAGGAQRDESMRAWAYAALLSDGGVRAAWDAVLADAGAELGRALPATCTAVLSLDDDRLTAAVRDVRGAATGVSEPGHRDAVVALPASLVAALDGCPTVAVVARPPLHGRPALLPPALPWFFLGARPADPPPVAARDLVVIADPAHPGAPRLTPPVIADARLVTGAAATPTNVLAALRTATYAELHVHGVADLAAAEGAFLLLAPEPDGSDRLTAGAVARARFTAAPVVVLGACRAAETTPFLQARWSLPDAFLTAGARAVIAADVELPDRAATALFAALRARIEAGEAPAAALAAVRTDPQWSTWAAHLMLFAAAP